jgi:hypothetical protein
MQSLFGHRWTDSYGSEPDDLWQHALAAASEAELKRAIKALMTRGGVHPPTLPEFLELAKPGQAKKAAQGAEPHTPEWNEGRDALLDKIAKQSRERGVVFADAQRVDAQAALAVATLSPGQIGHAEAKASYEAGAAARLARMTRHTPAEQLALYGPRASR